MSTEIAIHKPLVKASSELSQFLGMEVSAMIDTLKSQCFKGKRPDEITDAQLATYISVANALKLNPLLPGQMYPYPDRNGSVTVMLGPDGIFTLLSNNPDVVAQKDGGGAFWTEHGKDESGAETCTGFINHKTKGLLKKTIWVAEWVITQNPNWTSRRHHMAEIRALKQCARMVIHGLPMDPDEHRLGEMLNVTDTAPSAPEEKVERAPIPEKKKKGAAAAAAIDVTSTPATTEKGNPAPTQSDAKHAAEVMEANIAKTEAPAQEKPAEKPALATTQPPEGKVFTQSSTAATKDAEPAKTEPAPESRAFIKDGEEIVANVTVKKSSPIFATMDNKRAPSVIATVAGQFNNEVIQHNVEPLNVRQENGKDVFDLPAAWAVGTALKIKLLGKHFPAVKKVYAVVQSVEAVGSASGEGELG